MTYNADFEYCFIHSCYILALALSINQSLFQHIVNSKGKLILLDHNKTLLHSLALIYSSLQ